MTKQKITIPKGWKESLFIDCVNVSKKVLGVKKSDYEKSGKYPIVDQGQNLITGYINDEKYLFKEKLPVILFGDHTRIFKLIDFSFAPGADGIKIFWAKKGVDINFLYYSAINLNIPNTGYNRHFKYLEESKILLPSLSEQIKIAEILSKVDEDIEKTERVIKNSEKLKRGLMQELLTKGIGHKNFKKTKLGEIPKKWEIKKISEILTYERPDKYIVKSTIYNKNFKIPVLTANKSFIRGYTNEEFGIYRDLPVIIFDDFTTDIKFVDFLFKVKSSAIKILKCKAENSNLKFIYEKMKLIKFPVGNHKRYYISQYQDLEIVLPPTEEQKQIAEILSSVDDKIEINKQIKNKLTQLKKGLMQDLLSGRVRV